MPVLVALVAPACIDRDASPGGSVSGRDVVSAGLVALCDAATDDGLLKQLNLDVLMHTRAEDARVRVFALRCARALWTAHGSKLIGALGRRDSCLPYLSGSGLLMPFSFFFLFTFLSHFL